MSSKLIWSSLSYAYIKSKQYERLYEFINEDVKKTCAIKRGCALVILSHYGTNE